MKRLAAVAAVLLAACPIASAAPVYLRLDSLGAGVTNNSVQYRFNPSQSFTNLGNVFVGQFRMTYDVGGLNQALNTFCIDLTHRVNVGQQYLVNLRDLSEFTPPSLTGEMAYLYNTYGTGVMTNNHQAAALNLALWRLSLGTDGQLNFSMNATITNAYNAFLTEAASHSGTLGQWLDAEANGSHQNRGQSVIYPPPPGQQGGVVPVPGGLALLASGGLFGLAGTARRWKSKASLAA
jgi:hypothetical protein